MLLSGCGLNVGCLPLVGGAVTTTEGVGLGILEGVQYGFIDRAEVHAAIKSESFREVRVTRFSELP